jgi:hypothetical protein
MKRLVVGAAVLFVGLMIVSGLSTAPVQTFNPKGDIDAWVLFNTSTSYWKAGGDILPEVEHGMGFLTLVKAQTTNKAFN